MLSKMRMYPVACKGASWYPGDQYYQQICRRVKYALYGPINDGGESSGFRCNRG